MESLPSGIQYRHWPTPSAKACVLLVHGLAEHTGRYERVAARFNECGVAVVGPDHIGHGASPGVRCHVNQFAEYVAPLSALRTRIGDWYPDTPVFLLGHSMGGLIAAHALFEAQASYRGAMFSGPAFTAVDPVSSFTIWIGRLLRSLLPKMGMLALNAQEVSRDPEVVADYLADPLVFSGKITTSLGLEILDAMEAALVRAGALTLPVYIAHGDADVMAGPEGSSAFFEALSSDDKTLDFWPGLYHEIFHEPEAEEVIARYVKWLEAHL
ncbi:MAG: lysophospholipase [Luminiphilus sp.]|jgi:alpha-beta hydrolase superfamily lysophospholipase|nr:lysophospholipase [Luminiphilus sp.]